MKRELCFLRVASNYKARSWIYRAAYGSSFWLLVLHPVRLFNTAVNCLREKKKENNNYTEAGVGIVIDNELNNYIWDIHPYSNRLISMTLGYAISISFTSTYIPTSTADQDKNEEAYDQLKKVQI